jgi:hypothetical protein
MSRMRILAGADVTEARAFSRSYKGIVAGRAGASGDETWSHALLLYANNVLGSVTYVTDWTGPLHGGHPRFMSVEGTTGFVISGMGSPNMLRRVEDNRAVDYPMCIESRRIDGEEVPQRFYYETSPQVEVMNPFSDRVLDEDGSGGRWDGIARADELASIHRAVTTGAEPAYGLARARRDQELSIVVAEAARLGRPLPGRLEYEGETVWEAEQHEAFRRRWGFGPFDDAAFQAWQ